MKFKDIYERTSSRSLSQYVNGGGKLVQRAA